MAGRLRIAGRLRRDDGASVIELAFVLPVLLVILAVTVPLLKGGWEYMSLSRATAHGIRYATRADTNARPSAVGPTRRPTAEEVETFVRESAEGIELASVTVTPEPARALPGEIITVTATYEMTFGPLADLANGIGGIFFGGTYLPQSKVITVSAQGREE